MTISLFIDIDGEELADPRATDEIAQKFAQIVNADFFHFHWKAFDYMPPLRPTRKHTPGLKNMGGYEERRFFS